MNNDKFDPKDLEEICARKPHKYKMKKADFKELGRNILLGSLDVAIGGFKAVAIITSISDGKKVKSNTEHLNYGYRDGHQGYGFYFGDQKQDD